MVQFTSWLVVLTCCYCPCLHIPMRLLITQSVAFILVLCYHHFLLSCNFLSKLKKLHSTENKCWNKKSYRQTPPTKQNSANTSVAQQQYSSAWWHPQRTETVLILFRCIPMLSGISFDSPPASLHTVYQQAHTWSDHISVYFVSVFPSMQLLTGSDSPHPLKAR